MYAKISDISVILNLFIPHDSFLIISVTYSHSSIFSLLKEIFFSDFHLFHCCSSDTLHILQTHLRFLDKIILLSFLHIFMNMYNFVFSLFAMQFCILQNHHWNWMWHHRLLLWRHKLYCDVIMTLYGDVSTLVRLTHLWGLEHFRTYLQC